MLREIATAMIITGSTLSAYAYDPYGLRQYDYTVDPYIQAQFLYQDRAGRDYYQIYDTLDYRNNHQIILPTERPEIEYDTGIGFDSGLEGWEYY